MGSSPLTRGKLDGIRFTGAVPGLIPAHAGKTPPRGRRSALRRAHPRSRGENARPVSERSRAVGSSPLTRGKHGSGEKQLPASGLIPAHAGKTPGGSRTRVARRAHPRSRGENAEVLEDAGRPQGSSPLTRGKPKLYLGRGCRDRLIPAHAGKTSRSTQPGSHSGAHPRSRGENR